MTYPKCPHCKEKITSLIWNGLTPTTQTVTFHKSDDGIEEDWDISNYYGDVEYTCYYQCYQCKHIISDGLLKGLPIPSVDTEPLVLIPST